MSRAIPQYSQAAEGARIYLYTAFNDITIFVEDSVDKNIYMNLLKMILPENKNVKQVFGLGGREEVLKHYRENAKNYDFPKIYIIDCDLDLLTGKRKPHGVDLYRLDTYSIENLALCFDGLSEFLTIYDSNSSSDEIKQKLKLDDLTETFTTDMFPLFKMYAICELVMLGQKTINYNINRLCKTVQGNLYPDRKKIAQRIFTLRQACIQKVGFEEYLRVSKIITNRAKNIQKKIDCISVKDYLLPILKAHCKKKCGANLSNSQVAIGASKFMSHHNSGLSKAIRRRLSR